jgi:glycine dehydrogenase
MPNAHLDDAHSLLEPSDDFARRHLGPDGIDVAAMLAQIGVDSLDELVEHTIPAEIRSSEPLRLSGLPSPLGELAVLEPLRAHASRNRVLQSCIGMGYSDALVPPVIHRNVLENSGWYTQSTPYERRYHRVAWRRC